MSVAVRKKKLVSEPVRKTSCRMLGEKSFLKKGGGEEEETPLSRQLEREEKEGIDASIKPKA